MKSIVLALAAVLSFSSVSYAYPQSCSQLINKKDTLAAELDYLRAKIRASRNSDALELYMDQYEDLYARYQDAVANISDRCQ
ncbi:hypothetical protein BDW_12875 [Bdellovibrio bacteriovorus W]|nr:hypothetical protein BDW_12875 [Bdellovibrio bacteriovorus W]